VRRSKADIRKEDGSPLFPPRWVDTTAVTFTQEELNLYNRVTDYVRDGYRTATTLKDPAVGFLMVLLQKRMVSSIAAIRKSLERRLIALGHQASYESCASVRMMKRRSPTNAVSNCNASWNERASSLGRLSTGKRSAA
jgi:hypothetical protein